MPEHNERMEARVRSLEEGMRGLREELGELKRALLGTLDGKPGIMASLYASLEQSRSNAVKLDLLSAQVEGLRLNWAKASGIVAAVVTLLGLVYKLFLK